MDNMWVAEMEDGTTISEKDVKYWANMPTDKKIKNIKFKVPKLKLDFETGPAKKYCVAQIGLASISGNQKQVGYCIYYETEESMMSMTITATRSSEREVTEDLGIPDNAWRKGTLE